MWSRERNYGPGSSAGGGKCGPGREIMVLGQMLMAGSVVQGAKLRPGSTPSPPECGPRREIMVFGQTLVAGSMVQGAKLRVWVKHWWREVWSREPNCGPGSSPAEVWSREQNRAPGSPPAPPKCGPGSKTVPLGHPLPRRSMVQGAKLRPGSSQTPPKYGLGSKTALAGQTLPCPRI